MQRRTARKILSDDETLDVAKMAEAIILEAAEAEKKKKHPHSVVKVLNAWNDKRARIKAQEEFRQAVAKAWKKHHEK
jgi:hypothetical protein